MEKAIFRAEKLLDERLLKSSSKGFREKDEKDEIRSVMNVANGAENVIDVMHLQQIDRRVELLRMHPFDVNVVQPEQSVGQRQHQIGERHADQHDGDRSISRMVSSRCRGGRSDRRGGFRRVTGGEHQGQIGARSLIFVRNGRRFGRSFAFGFHRSRRLSGALRGDRTFSLRRRMCVMKRIGGCCHQSLPLTQPNDDHDIHRRDKRQGKNV